MPQITNSNGDISAYGLALGYRDTDHDMTADGRVVEFALSWNGCTYDVDVSVPGETRQFLRTDSGGQILEGWAQFDSLTKARAFKRKLMRTRSLGEARVKCLSVMA